MMVFTVTTIKVIYSHEVMWFKSIEELISNAEVPVVADLIGIVVILIAI